MVLVFVEYINFDLKRISVGFAALNKLLMP